MPNANYWPWWMGGVGLALVAVGFPLLNRTPLGVSGAMGRLVALLTPGKTRPSCNDESAAEGGEAAAVGCDPMPPIGIDASRPPAWRSPVFLVSMLVGGSLAAGIGGTGFGGSGLSVGFRSLFGDGAGAVAALFLGGLLVGFGTRWSGGCTSGHGLSGVGRLQPASLAATGVFFGTAIVVSFLLERMLR